jgi:hypothetical protein
VPVIVKSKYPVYIKSKSSEKIDEQPFKVTLTEYLPFSLAPNVLLVAPVIGLPFIYH